MLTRNCEEFLAYAHALPGDFGRATAKAAFLVSPDGFARAEQSATDNRYMAAAQSFDASSAQAEHRALQQALSQDVPVVCFHGDASTPDALFPNNVFATARPGAGAGKHDPWPRFIVGRMHHPVRRKEAERADIRGFLRDVLGYAEVDLSAQPHPCELTGALVIDRARGIGFCGLSERCDHAGAAAMHKAFGLRATLAFDLAAGEYHTNVLMALLAARAVLLSPDGFADQCVPGVIRSLYGPHVIEVSAAEQAAFACNAIALSESRVWMSEGARASLTGHTRKALDNAGFEIGSVPLAAIEAAGGSLRCCVAELF